MRFMAACALHVTARVTPATAEYERKVREIAVMQCRCGTGADLETDRPRLESLEQEQPTFA